MKRLPVLIAVAIAWGAQVPAAAGPVQSQGFYQFAQKSAELYRGQLFSRPEVEIFVRQIKQQSAQEDAALQAFHQAPYDLVRTAAMLNWLDEQCRKNNCSKLQAFKDRLELHYNQLKEIASVYEG